VAPPPTEQIKVSFAADTAIYAPHFIAIEKGYYQEEGIEMEMIRAGGGAATPALISGELQYSTSAATALSAMLKGAPMKVIYTNSDRSLDELWSSTPDVRTLQDLVGKAVGVQTRGDTMEIQTRLILMKHGIDPNTVSIQAMGVGPQRLAALQSGAIPAAIISVADVVQLQAMGTRGQRLADIRNEIRMLYTGLASHERELTEHRDRARRFLRGTIKGREYFKAHREDTLQILEKYNSNGRSANEADYEVTRQVLTEDGSIPADVQRADALARAEVNEVDPSQLPPVEQMYDYSLVKEIYQELQARGWKP
jgi:NitT/TauT family transport system substrate-binding protein